MNPSARLRTALASLALGLAFTPASPAQELRVWTDTQGRTLKATMVRVDLTTSAVIVQREDGTEVPIPIAMLSPADKDYARAQWQTMQNAPATTPAATPSTPPAAGGGTPPPAPAAPPSGQAAPPPPAFEIIPPDKFKLPKPDDYLRSVPRTPP
ncbi:MAG: hypothetical protein KDK99_14515, partial [Verrucomicrobiales bacterium]|nr:hypothetical protein [Verrucomicrobiales bacterium]